MRLPVRWSAALMVAGAFTFAACGSDTAEAPVTPDASQGPLEYTVTPNAVEWSPGEDDAIPTDPKTVLIGGVIAAGGYPSFGATQWAGGIDGSSSARPGWFTMTTAPDFSRDPLGWRFTFRLNPSVVSQLTSSASATIAVNVPAARNNPQMITVRYNLCTALQLGDNGLASLDSGDPIWDRSSTYNNDVDEDLDDRYPYDEYCLTIPAGTTYRVDMIGECSELPGVSHEDVYLYSWYDPELDTSNGFIDSDDDGGDCNNSVIFIENESGAPRVATIRATSYGDLEDEDRRFGNYRILVSEGGDDFDDLREVHPRDAAEKATKGAVRR